jgi:hypothetical protein
VQLEPTPGFAREPITLAEAKSALSTGQWGDDPALKLVIQDSLRAENFASTKQWVMQWPSATALYQSPFAQSYWDGTMVPRASIPLYSVATAVNSLVPQIISGLFAENPPFMIQPRPGTKAQAARAIGGLLAYQLEDIDFRKSLYLGVTNCVLFGTAIWKWGWETFTKERKMYVRSQSPIKITNPLASAGAAPIEIEGDDDIEEQVVEEYVDRPVFEHIVNLRHVLVDPGLNVPDIRKAKYVIHRNYVTWDDLDKMRERPGYDIPSRTKLLELFFPPKEQVEAAASEVAIRNPLWDARAEARFEETTEDPFEKPLEILERWDGKKIIVVLQKKLVICNDDNPYGEIPFLSIGWWDVPEAFYSLGLAKTIGSEQRLQQGIINTWLDNAALNLNGVYTRKRGKSIPTQNIRIAPGRIVDVEEKDDFKPLDRLPAVPEAGQHLALSQSRIDTVSGANPANTQGMAGETGHSNLARSAAGASLIGAGGSARSQDFIEKLSNQVIVPFLYSAHELNRSLLPKSTIRYILNEELQHAFLQGGPEGGDIIELLNARVKFSILAGAKMQARRNMASSLPLLFQLLTNPQTENQLAIQGLKIDVAELVRCLYQVSDWANVQDVLIPMNAEDQKRWQAMQPGAQIAAKGQQQQQMLQQKHDNDLDLVENQNLAKAGREVLRHALETSEVSEATNGIPNTQGFGSMA